MTMTTIDRPDLDAGIERAASQVRAERETLAEWESRLAAAESEQAGLTGTSGEELLANPGLEVDLADRLSRIKSRIALIRQAVAAQEPRVLLAESRWFAAQADAHEQAIPETQAALDAHRAKTEQLLAELAEHECEYVSRHAVVTSQISDGAVYAAGPPPLAAPKSHGLARALLTAQLHVEVLRRLAAGRDPAALLHERPWLHAPAELMPENIYPGCVQGPDALVQAPAFANRLHRLREHVAELERLSRELPAEIATWEARLQRAQADGQLDAEGHPTAAYDQRSLKVDPTSDESPFITEAGLLRRCARLESLEDELLQARQALAEMEGTADVTGREAQPQ